MSLLLQFLFRVSFGLAVGMGLTSSRQVTSGYFRNHLYVLLGFAVLATLVALKTAGGMATASAVVAALASYVGAVCWLYEKPRAGKFMLAVVALASLWGSWASAVPPKPSSPLGLGLAWLDPPTAGLLIGVSLAAMFLGHWYLNTPTMALGPLRKLIVLMGVLLVIRVLVSGGGLMATVLSATPPDTFRWTMLAVRWLFGLLLVGGTTIMAWETLKIPNTQSATGILYVAVIGTFLGELVSLLISSEQPFPL